MKTIRIFAIDDEPYVLEVIKKRCTDFTIETETSPIAALEKIKEKNFDIFIIDYRMPLLNGIEILEEIKKIYKTKPYIGILSTAYGTTYLFESERSQGLFHFFIEKPFKEEAVPEAIKKAIEILSNE